MSDPNTPNWDAGIVTEAEAREMLKPPEPAKIEAEIPKGTEFVVYWCPRCKVQSRKRFHFCSKGPALIPQMDEETRCVSIILTAKGGET